MLRSDRPLRRSRDGAVRPAVVIGLDSITGLQTARILAAHGVPVVGIVADRRHWGARTNACYKVVESPMTEDALVTTLLRLGERLDGPAVLFPCTDPGVRAVSSSRATLAGQFVLALSPHPVVEMLMDKARFARHAEQIGLPVPRTVVLETREDAEAAVEQLHFPCVLKPPGKSAGWLAHTSAKGFAAAGADDLLRRYDQVATWSAVLVAQEWVEGPETALFSCNAYFGSDGVPLVTFVARKIRQWPPEIGTSASGEECRDDDVLDATVRLFGSVGFWGLAYLEVKRDVRTGGMMLIEPNVGRPTGRSAIAEAGGVELVYTAYCDALGLPLPPERHQRYRGAKWLDVRRDAQAAVAARRRGELTAGQWVRSVRGPKAHAIWSPRDPGPFLADLRQASATGARLLGARWSVPARPAPVAISPLETSYAEATRN